MTSTWTGVKRLATEMARTRDPAGYADLTTRCEANPVGECTIRVAMHRIAAILAAKGGVVADVTIGDCLQLLDIAAGVCTFSQHKSPYFYQLLHALGVFDATAALTVRALSAQRQLSVEQLIDRCDIACRPVRDLLVDAFWAWAAVEVLRLTGIVTRNVSNGALRVTSGYFARDVFELLTFAERRLASTRWNTRDSPPSRPVPAAPEG